MHAPSTLSGRLLELFEEVRLTPSHRRVAHVLLKEGQGAAYLSSTELAALAGVSQPSVSRFARALGFSGYQELRQHIRALAETGPGESSPDALRNELQAAINDEIDNLRLLSRSFDDPTQFYRLAAAMARSDPLVVLGLRASAGLAEHVGYFARRALGRVRVITRYDSIGQEDLRAALDDGATWMLAIALPRYPSETLEAVRAARERGVRIVTVTDSSLGPFTEHSERVLPVGVSSRLVFDSHGAAVVLCNALLGALCDADQLAVQARLDAFEESARARRIFIT